MTSRLGAIIKLKEQCAEWTLWEMISMESPTFKNFWAKWSMLVVRDGVLFRKWESKRREEITWKLVLPDTLKKEVLKRLHDNSAAGHFGFRWAGKGTFLLLWSTKTCQIYYGMFGVMSLPQGRSQTKLLEHQCQSPYGEAWLQSMWWASFQSLTVTISISSSSWITSWNRQNPLPHQTRKLKQSHSRPWFL